MISQFDILYWITRWAAIKITSSVGVCRGGRPSEAISGTICTRCQEVSLCGHSWMTYSKHWLLEYICVTGLYDEHSTLVNKSEKFGSCDYVNYEKHIRNAMTKDENVQLLLLFKMDWMNSKKSFPYREKQVYRQRATLLVHSNGQEMLVEVLKCFCLNSYFKQYYSNNCRL